MLKRKDVQKLAMLEHFKAKSRISCLRGQGKDWSPASASVHRRSLESHFCHFHITEILPSLTAKLSNFTEKIFYENSNIKNGEINIRLQFLPALVTKENPEFPLSLHTINPPSVTPSAGISYRLGIQTSN